MDGGGRWVKMNNNMPNVPVHDLLVHPRDNDLVVGSYGRGLFITNINALQQLNDTVLTSDAHLFAVRPTVQRIVRAFAANDYLFGQRNFQTPNEPNGMVIQYFLKARRGGARRESPLPTPRGRRSPADGTGQGRHQLGGVDHTRPRRRRQGAAAAAGAGVAAAPRQAGPGVDALAQWAPLGDYTVTLDVGGQDVDAEGADHEDAGLVDRRGAAGHQVDPARRRRRSSNGRGRARCDLQLL